MLGCPWAHLFLLSPTPFCLCPPPHQFCLLLCSTSSCASLVRLALPLSQIIGWPISSKNCTHTLYSACVTLGSWHTGLLPALRYIWIVVLVTLCKHTLSKASQREIIDYSTNWEGSLKVGYTFSDKAEIIIFGYRQASKLPVLIWTPILASFFRFHLLTSKDLVLHCCVPRRWLI